VSLFGGSAALSGADSDLRATHSSWVTSLGWAICTFLATGDLQDFLRQGRNLGARLPGRIGVQHCLAACEGLSEPYPLRERHSENSHAINGERPDHITANGSIYYLPAYRKGGSQGRFYD
jgi:hypothetical protein